MRNLNTADSSFVDQTHVEHVLNVVKCKTDAVYVTDKVYTYQDYLKLPEEEGFRYEILDGMLVKEPVPNLHHQRIARRLLRILEDFFMIYDPLGEVFIAPVDITLSNTDVCQPDLLYISGHNSKIMEEKRINGAPHLVVEILSPATRTNDCIKKRMLYERLGIPHYWVVDPENKDITAYALSDGTYNVRNSTVADQYFTHPDFPGLHVDLPALWKPSGW